MLVAGQLSAGCEARQNRAALGFLILPNRFLLNPGHGLGPWNFTQVEILRGWRTGTISRGLDASGNNGKDGRAVLAIYAVDASVGSIANIARRGGAMLVGDCTFNNVE